MMEADPKKIRFDGFTYVNRCFLFEDGSFGETVDADFNYLDYIDEEDPHICELIEGYMYGTLKDDTIAEKVIRGYFDGLLPTGCMYIDRWYPDGTCDEGGCFIYYIEDTMKDFCERNGYPLPVKEIPHDVIEMFESKDFSRLEELKKEVPELETVRIEE